MTHRIRTFPTTTLALLFCGAVATGWNGYAAEIAFLHRPGGEPEFYQQAKSAARFYGLGIKTYDLSDKEGVASTVKALRPDNTFAVVITADALSALNPDQLLAALSRNGSANVPLLVIGITTETEPELLKKWSAGAVGGCRQPVTASEQGAYRIGTVKDVTRQLSGQTLTAKPGQTCMLAVDPAKAQPVISLASSSGESPIFVRTEVRKQERFFSAGMKFGDRALPPGAYDQAEYQFSTVAPALMFLRYAAGDRAWHSNGHYANLTIDDTRLVDPYGHVRYFDLLREMQRHNFHTTIAFIPWNFDRNNPDVVSLFREHSDRYSICVHGNNHDHQEFPSLKTRSLEIQEPNIRQALARMAKFQQLTQIPYDPVMVFPHSVAPAETLSALKRYNFLATANSRNISLGSSPVPGLPFALRPMTLAFGNFPSLRRYSAEFPISKSALAADAFLGSPMLFYVHEAYFAEGTDHFNSVADMVNQLQPDTSWRGLGSIAQHLYLERSRDDGNYDIEAFTGTLQLENVHQKDAVFFIAKDETFQYPLQLFVDGQPLAYSRVGNRLCFQVPVPAGKSCQVTIRYQDELNLSTVDISKSSLRVAGLRHLSEFRDNVVSRSSIGRTLIKAYTRNPSRMAQGSVVLFLCLALAGLALFRRARRTTLPTGTPRAWSSRAPGVDQRPDTAFDSS